MNRDDLLISVIGNKWKPGGRGPKEWDCYHLTRFVQQTLFGRSMPEVDFPEKPSLRWMMDTIENHPERKRWGMVRYGGGIIDAADGSIILMARNQLGAHIGTWMAKERRVLHSDQRVGVQFEPMSMLKAMSWRNISFLEPK